MNNPAQTVSLTVAILSAALTALVVSMGVVWLMPASQPGATPTTDVAPQAKREAITQATAPQPETTPNRESGATIKLEEQVQALTEELRQEQSSRLELQRQVASLEDQLEVTGNRLRTVEEQSSSVEVASQGAAAVAGESRADTGQRGNRWRGPRRRGGVTSATVEERIDYLQQAGIDPLSAREIVEGDDKRQLAELELRDAAVRGGWQHSDEFRTQMDELEASAPDLRTQLGDEAYDRYLYASGEPNRIIITNVLNGSAADAAGIQASDLILSYAGSRVFGIRELQQATREGLRGESVPVTLKRGEELLDVAVSRGPLGVSLSRDSLAP